MSIVNLSNRKLWNNKYLRAVLYPKTYNVLFGGSGCFGPNQLIETDKGSKPICEIKEGDMVLSYNHESGLNEFRKVKNTFQYENASDRLIEIVLKDGTIIKVTENHKFFFGGSYVKIKDILLSLEYGNRNLEKDSGLCPL